MAGQIESKLVELGIELPQAAAAVANYVSYVIDGGQLWIAGQVPFWNGAVKYTGLVGENVSLDEAVDAARICALNILAQTKAALGDLDRVRRVIKLGGFVNAVPGFTDHPKIINGASDLMVEIAATRESTPVRRSARAVCRSAFRSKSTRSSPSTECGL